MKQLVVYFLTVALIVLLLPLPALRVAGTSEADSGSSATTHTLAAKRTNRSTTATTTRAPSAVDTAVFRVALEDEVREIEEKTFLRAVVVCEMPLSYAKEALKAQAVASYTYYSRKREEARAKGETADFSDVPAHFEQCITEEGLKARLGQYYDTYAPILTEVIDEVYGYTIRYNGQKILAAYHAISCGVTESGKSVWLADYPYLQSVPSDGDKTADGYLREQTFTEKEIKEAFKGVKGADFTEKPSAWFGKAECNENGLVERITVGGVEQTGTQVRTALGLRSSHFTVAHKDKAFTFTVKGYGHGVGMSQFGAHCLGKQGADWREILQHYYTDVTIEKDV